MQEIAGSYPQPDSRNDDYFSVVPDRMSLVEHIQHACAAGLGAASHCMLDTETPEDGADGIDDAIAARPIWRITHKGGRFRRPCPAGSFG
jgi:hypothetical protein